MPRFYGKFEQHAKLCGIILDILLSRVPFPTIEKWTRKSNRDELEQRIVEILLGENEKFFVSRFFRLRSVFKISKNSENFLISEKFIKNLFEKIYERESRLCNHGFTLHIDAHIWEKLHGLSVVGVSKDLSVGVYELLADLNNGQIFEKAEEAGIKKIFSYMEGLFIIRQAILVGNLDQKDSKIFVFFKIGKDSDEIYRFRASRQANNRISINMYEVNKEFEWPLGCGVIFKK